MFQSITQTKNVNKNLNKLLICKKRKLLFFFLFLVTAKLPSDRQRQSTLRTSISLSWECLNPERSPSRGSFEYKAELQHKGRQSHPAQTPRSVKVVCESWGVQPSVARISTAPKMPTLCPISFIWFQNSTLRVLCQ